MKKNTLIITIAILAVGLFLYIGRGLFLSLFLGCSKTSTPINEGKPTISVTIEPYRYFVNQIAGDKVNVNVMVPAGSNPETYEPTAQQMMKLSNSTLYFKVGKIGFEETWMKKLTDNAPAMTVIDTSKGITPVKTAGGIIDPHTWMSTTSAVYITNNICKALCKAMPQDSIYFIKRRMQFTTVIEKTNKQIAHYIKCAKIAREQMTQKKTDRIPFVIYHPALTYFAKDFGLLQYPIEEEGREPSIAQLQALIDKAKQEQIETVYIQKEFANRNTQTFIDATGAKPTNINPLAYDWEKEMITVAIKLAESYGYREKQFHP